MRAGGGRSAADRAKGPVVAPRAPMRPARRLRRRCCRPGRGLRLPCLSLSSRRRPSSDFRLNLRLHHRFVLRRPTGRRAGAGSARVLEAQDGQGIGQIVLRVLRRPRIAGCDGGGAGTPDLGRAGTHGTRRGSMPRRATPSSRPAGRAPGGSATSKTTPLPAMCRGLPRSPLAGDDDHLRPLLTGAPKSTEREYASSSAGTAAARGGRAAPAGFAAPQPCVLLRCEAARPLPDAALILQPVRRRGRLLAPDNGREPSNGVGQGGGGVPFCAVRRCAGA